MTRIRAALAFFLAAAPLLAQAPGSPQGPAGAGRQLSRATFAGGCFWCMEPPFEALNGVVSVTSGYTGGSKENPTYVEVSSGRTGHTEAVQVVYEPAKISYERLLDVYWRNVDPTDRTGQFCDRGSQYRPAIFVHDDTQRRLAEASKVALGKTKPFAAPVVVEIVPASAFWPAEEYHQRYHSKNPIRYKYYRAGCGRDARLRELWGDAK